MSDPTALVAELLRHTTRTNGLPLNSATADLCRAAAALIAQQAATIEAVQCEAAEERCKHALTLQALTAAEAERGRLARTIGHRDRRIARLVEAMEFARSKGVVFPADSEPPVVLSDAARAALSTAKERAE